jgi:Ser/Thr protein kinase RdoA (MazF antagonist)
VSDFTFEGLTPALILDAIESVGIHVSSGLLALNSYENRVYQFVTDDHGRMVAKFYRPKRWSNEQILEEHAFAFELQSHELPIVAPSKFNSVSLHTFKGYRFALFPSVGGRQFEVDNLEQLEWMGRLIGRIHATSAKKPFQHRLHINIPEYLHEPCAALRRSALVPFHLHLPFFTILDQVCLLAESQYNAVADNVSHIRLHGDCHPGNILWRDGPMFVDLDDCRTGPAIQDLWMMLAGDTMQQQMQLKTLIDAYEEFNPFNTQELGLIEPLRAMRMVHYMAWLSKRWNDPAFPRAFPWFGEDKYWENQILSLKEQFSALQQPSIRLPSH